MLEALAWRWEVSKVGREFKAEYGRDWMDGCWGRGTGKAV